MQHLNLAMLETISKFKVPYKLCILKIISILCLNKHKFYDKSINFIVSWIDKQL
jgi:hypothetical protein